MRAANPIEPAYEAATRRLFSHDWLVVVLLFIMAAVIRWMFVLYHPRLDGFLIYQGKPLSDGCSYTYKAISIAQGHGIPPVQQPAVRPFYPITLACLFTWVGFSLAAVTILNILIAACTAPLIYLCGARALNRFCGLGAALFFAIDPSQLLQTPQAGTEPLGLLLFVASVYALLRAFVLRRASLFFVSGVFIALSNLTRTLTIFSLPFYLGLILLVIGWHERAWKRSALHALAILAGFAVVVLPWMVRQERLYGILTISDNIGEAFYAATSPKYRQWTPLVHHDADAKGVPNTVGARYRYFMQQAIKNVTRDPGFYLHNVGAAIWEYANTFNPASRASPRYIEEYSAAHRSQRLLAIYLVVLLAASWLVSSDYPFAKLNLLRFGGSLALVVVYYFLPPPFAFCPILAGIVLSFRAEYRLGAIILSGSLASAVFGSVVFANPTLFRAILMTDWLFLYYLLFFIWYSGLVITKAAAVEPDAMRTLRLEKSKLVQGTHSRSLERLVSIVVLLLLNFFLISAVRIVALTICNPPVSEPRQLSKTEVKAVDQKLRRPPFNLPLEANGALEPYADWSKRPDRQPGQLVLLVQEFDYYYYIPAGKMPPRGRPDQTKPYGRSLVILSQFDFTMNGEIPDEFAGRQLIFVGMVTGQNTPERQLPRFQLRGLAVVPLDQHHRPIFNRAVSTPPAATAAPVGLE